MLQGGGVYFTDAGDLARSIGLLENGELDLKEMGKWQAKRIKEEYNWDNVAGRYSSLFKELLKICPY